MRERTILIRASIPSQSRVIIRSEKKKVQSTVRQGADEQTDHLMVNDYRRPWTPATSEWLQARCRPWREGLRGRGKGIGKAREKPTYAPFSGPWTPPEVFTAASLIYFSSNVPYLLPLQAHNSISATYVHLQISFRNRHRKDSKQMSLHRLRSDFETFDENRSLALIKESLKIGINYLETGPWYGQGSSERTIGKALQNIPRETFFIGSKVGRYELKTEKMFDFSAEKTEAAVDNTLNLLNLDYVDLIQVHDATFAPDISVVLKETLPALEKAVKEGKARYIGLADYDIDLMKEIIEESDVKISSILSYAKSTLFDNRLQNYTKYFKRTPWRKEEMLLDELSLFTRGIIVYVHFARVTKRSV
ncbi:unnamed protein product [Diatraea saccharalis]|uniref:NADP-dependent oxidoreductase domain-containing protein n=1 Tax=Diatraea saccharalis TaxID=40085 RepID=A0A9N9N4E7_9NEOP|nr:unnamed protein product [Diatraea saccharalis]